LTIEGEYNSKGEREVQELEKDVVDPRDLLLWPQYTEFKECVVTLLPSH